MQLPTHKAEPRSTGSLIVCVLILIVGACLGIVYCAYQGSLLGVIAAALIPGVAVAWVLEPAQAIRARGRDSSHGG